MSGEGTKVLLIEDNPGDARFIGEMLSEAGSGPFAVRCEETLAAGLERLGGESFDVLLLDLSLPDSWGLDTLRAVLERAVDFPVVVITGMQDPETAWGALDLGAQDYLVKGQIDADSLERSIRYALARHRSEEALRDSEEHYRRLVEGVGDVILTTDLDLNITFISLSVERSTGYTAEEVLGRNIREFITAESFEKVAEWFSENLARQAETYVGPPVPVIMEVEQIRKDGSTYPVEIRVGFLRGQGGAPFGIHVVSRDMTERREAGKRVRKAQRQAVSVLMNLPDAVLAADPETGIIVDCNGPAEELFERTRDELVGVRQTELHPPGDADYYAGVFREHTRRGRGFAEEAKIITASGEVRDVTISPVMLSVGEQMLTFGVFHDVSERRRMEEERERLNQELERRVIERTAKLQALNKEMESFAYSVSHDLRVPLRAIDGFARMLAEEHSGHLDEEGLRLLSIIRQNSDYMAELIEHLLMLSGVDRREPAEAEVDMNALARQVAEEYERSLAGRSLEFAFEDLPPARGDFLLWQQVWENLLSNAVKFTRNEDRAQVQVGCLGGDRENVYFVKDNGAGFDMQYADRLFGVFRRLHSPEEYEGVGVGLALVQRIVRRHGGRVWAEGKPGEGATFFFTAFPVSFKGEHVLDGGVDGVLRQERDEGAP